MNKAILMGRLTRDPDVRYSGSGDASTCIAKFTLAVDRRRTSQNGEREADFISCVAFGKQAEFCEKYLNQGKKVVLSGRIQTGSYVNKDNQKVYTTDVVAEDIEFAESKANEQGGGNYQGGYSRGGQQNQYQAAAPAQNFSRPADDSVVGQGFLNIPDGVEDEGLPFN